MTLVYLCQIKYVTVFPDISMKMFPHKSRGKISRVYLVNSVQMLQEEIVALSKDKSVCQFQGNDISHYQENNANKSPKEIQKKDVVSFRDKFANHCFTS